MAGDLFAAQATIRRASIWLVLGFLAAVASSVAIACILVAGYLWLTNAPIWQPPILVKVAASVAGAILFGTLWKIQKLSAKGGAEVAEALGGRRVAPDTIDPDERRLLNLVAELAIAAAIPPPACYLLEHEKGINAFAAGWRPEAAVVAVTRGALDRLSRDELQGVIAHEFGHILNGDMRLNMWLLAALHGLLLVSNAGRVLLHHSRLHSSAGRYRLLGALLGVAFLVAGSVSGFFGALLRAAVVRQREFLADAAAVQFTRNPEGLLSALYKILTESQPIAHPNRAEIRHFLFDGGTPLLSGFSSHPPVRERIRRLIALAPLPASSLGTLASAGSSPLAEVPAAPEGEGDAQAVAIQQTPTAARGLMALAATNLLTVAVAFWQEWGVVQLFWPFWMQSLVIGWYGFLRLFRLERFSTEGFLVNGRPTEATPAAAKRSALFFLLHYGAFHLGYLLALLYLTFSSDAQGVVWLEHRQRLVPLYVGKISELDLVIDAALTLGFFWSHYPTYRQQLAVDRQGQSKLGHLMAAPYLRIIPLHVTLILAIPFGGKGAVLFFALLKGLVDLVMHRVEAALLAPPSMKHLANRPPHRSQPGHSASQSQP